jgi:hypothetical protein
VYYKWPIEHQAGNQNPPLLTIIVIRSSIRQWQIKMTHIPKSSPETPKYDLIWN